jgi:hypothetical protein
VACIPIGFFFMATEFARQLWRGEDFLGSMMAVAGAEPERREP